MILLWFNVNIKFKKIKKYIYIKIFYCMFSTPLGSEYINGTKFN